MKSLRLSVICLAVLSAFGCTSKIGDGCKSSSDCSVNGERVCDLAQPGGYCTILGCDPDTCPGSSLCVEWRFMPSRTAETWCMKACNGDNNCRRDYRCAMADQISQADGLDGGVPNANDAAVPEEDRVARVIDLATDRQTRGFCVAR